MKYIIIACIVAFIGGCGSVDVAREAVVSAQEKPLRLYCNSTVGAEREVLRKRALGWIHPAIKTQGVDCETL